MEVLRAHAPLPPTKLVFNRLEVIDKLLFVFFLERNSLRYALRELVTFWVARLHAGLAIKRGVGIIFKVGVVEVSVIGLVPKRNSSEHRLLHASDSMSARRKFVEEDFQVEQLGHLAEVI